MTEQTPSIRSILRDAKEPRRQLNVRLTGVQLVWVTWTAQSQRTSQNAIIRTALDRFRALEPETQAAWCGDGSLDPEPDPWNPIYAVHRKRRHQINVYLPASQRAWVNRMANTREISMSAVIRAAVDWYMRRGESDSR